MLISRSYEYWGNTMPVKYPSSTMKGGTSDNASSSTECRIQSHPAMRKENVFETSACMVNDQSKATSYDAALYFPLRLCNLHLHSRGRFLQMVHGGMCCTLSFDNKIYFNQMQVCIECHNSISFLQRHTPWRNHPPSFTSPADTWIYTPVRARFLGHLLGNVPDTSQFH